ncbi:MAG: hypothetical protein IH622_13560 [Ochrobactrum anthropi]|uniref:Uncharacterized protein n=1 Tax=Brucella anthropi TaxID=529 RepID=A0A8I0T9N0_BRUAN|nr:hypothetical protein [Brucella anthropi]MBE0561824.1 hypothetical protein [Brucella anthropi]
MSKLNVLIGGEYSGTIRDAFLALGHNAMSCDFSPTSVPGPHYQGDWADVENDGWDLAIFHRTCTFMANSGAKHIYLNMSKNGGLNEDRWLKMGRDAWAFWHHMQTCPVKFAAWENPVMLGYAQLMIGKPDQTVQPWWFGTDENGPDNVKKATCWWTMGGLPKLRRTGTLDGSTAREEVFKMAPTSDPEERRMARSKFTPGHAAAIARQWGDFVMAQKELVTNPTPKMNLHPVLVTNARPSGGDRHGE